MPEGRAEVSSGSSRLDLWRHLSETQTSAGLTASDKWEPVKAKQLTLSTLIPNERAPTHTHAHGAHWSTHTGGWGPVSHVRRLDGLGQQSHTFSAGGSQGATPQHSIHPYDRSETEREELCAKDWFLHVLVRGWGVKKAVRREQCRPCLPPSRSWTWAIPRPLGARRGTGDYACWMMHRSTLTPPNRLKVRWK